MFAAFKIIATFVLACVSVGAAIVKSGHPLLFGCLSAAFLVGVFGAEAMRFYRAHTVRSSISQ